MSRRQKQNRPATRAPHGQPQYDARVSFYCTAKLKRKLMRRGGSEFIRSALHEIIKALEENEA